MKKWRILLIVMIILAFIVLVGSELLYERPWAWLAWRNAFMLRDHFLLRNASLIEDIPRRFLMLFAGLSSLMMISGLMMYASPHRIRRIAECFSTSTKSLLRYSLNGLLGLMALGAIAALSTFSAYTFPFSFLIFLLIFFSSLMGIVGMGYQLGRSLFMRAQWESQSPLLQMSVGILITFATVRIPFLSLPILLVIVSMGFGATLSTHFGSGKVWTLRPLLEEEL
jgi:MFS family permease